MTTHSSKKLQYRETLNPSYTGDEFPVPAIRAGHTVTLRYDEETIIAKVALTGEESFAGLIAGFSPPVSIPYKGMQVGDGIVFKERHILRYND